MTWTAGMEGMNMYYGYGTALLEAEVREIHFRIGENRTNELINRLCFAADDIDPEYSRACGEATCDNREPVTEPEKIVRALHSLALALNGVLA